MIAHSNGGTSTSSTESRRLLLFDDDPILRGLVAALCDKHQWRLADGEDGLDALLPPQPERPKFLLFGFSLDDENAIELLWDLHAMYPHAPVGVITADATEDVADVVGLAGGTAVVVGPWDAGDVPETLRPVPDQAQH